MLLVRFDRNWADEFDVYGIKLFTTEEWEIYKAAVLARPSISMSFGTNEGWDDEDPADWLRSFNVTEISDEDGEAFKRMFPNPYDDAFRDNMRVTLARWPEAVANVDTDWAATHEFGVFPKQPSPANADGEFDDDW